MDDIGTLIIRVYTSRAQIPISGATVVVTHEGKGGRRELLSLQVTDSSGAILPLQISTPLLGESTAPHTDGPVPFAICSVWAEHPGYAMLQVDGVQIFPGVETTQDMELIPLAEGQSSLQVRDLREITAQSL